MDKFNADSDAVIKKGETFSIWDGSTETTYKKEPDEYITVNNCDVTRHTLHKTDVQLTERKNGRADYYILYVVSGRLIATINGINMQAFAGDMILYYPNTPQRVLRRKADKTDNYWVHFNGYAIPEILEQCGFTQSGVYHVSGAGGEKSSAVICDAFKQLMSALKLKKSKVRINQLFMHVICTLSEEASDALPNVPASRVLSGIMQMSWEFKNPRPIAEYAALCGMSPNWYTTVFKQATGKTPSAFIEDIRISKAKEHLLTTTMSMTEIAESVGYKDSLYFSRVFKKTQGASPSAFRKKQ